MVGTRQAGVSSFRNSDARIGTRTASRAAAIEMTWSVSVTPNAVRSGSRTEVMAASFRNSGRVVGRAVALENLGA